MLNFDIRICSKSTRIVLIIFVSIDFIRSPVAGRLAAVDLLLSPGDKLDPGPALIDCPRISIKAATLLIILHTTT